MRGGVAGVGVDDKENTPTRGTGKKGKEKRRSRGSGARSLSISGSKPRLHYLKVTNRFQRKGGFGRGRITAHRPVHFDGSPYDFSLRSDSEGGKRKSFVVFEDVDCASSKSKQVESTAESEARGKVLPVADSKNVAVENCRTPNTQGTVEQVVSRAPVQHGSKYHVMENFVAFRARYKSMFSANLRPRAVASLVGLTNQQESSSRPSLETLAAKWQRGGRRSLFTQRLLDTSEVEDLEQTFRKMDEEDLEKEMHENNLEMELHKYALEDVMPPRSQQEHGELFVPVKASEAHETVVVPVEEQANVGEPFITHRWDFLSPRIGGLGTEGEGANVDLATPLPNGPKENLRSDQEVPFSQATPVILELGVSPEASETDRAIKQQTPPSIKNLTPPAIKQPTSPASLPFTGCNNQVLDTLQQVPEDVESQIAQTVEAVQMWSVELDPSRRRRETMQCYRNRRSPWIKSLVLSSFQSANQLPGTTTDNVLRMPAMPMDYFDRVTPFNISRPLSPLSSSEFVLNGPAKNLVDSYEGGFLSTNLPSSSEEDMIGKGGDAEIADDRCTTSPDHTTIDEFEVHVPFTGNDQDMQALKDSEASVRNSRPSLKRQVYQTSLFHL